MISITLIKKTDVENKYWYFLPKKATTYGNFCSTT